MSSDLQVFSHKPQYWTSLNFDLVMALEGKLGDRVITIDPEADVNAQNVTAIHPMVVQISDTKSKMSKPSWQR